MPIYLYRGDTRTPQQIKEAKGFQARAPLTPAIARDLVSRCNGNAAQVVVLPAPANISPLQAALNGTKAYNLGDLMQGIKQEKNHATVHISTDGSPAAGGYASAYVYRMNFDLHFQRGGVGPIVVVNDIDQLSSPVRTDLVFNNGNGIDGSTLIAISRGATIPGTEVAFLTSIPYVNITHYQAPGNPAWIAMP